MENHTTYYLQLRIIFLTGWGGVWVGRERVGTWHKHCRAEYFFSLALLSTLLTKLLIRTNGSACRLSKDRCAVSSKSNQLELDIRHLTLELSRYWVRGVFGSRYLFPFFFYKCERLFGSVAKPYHWAYIPGSSHISFVIYTYTPSLRKGYRELTFWVAHDAERLQSL